ncbi:hypothetical protein NQ117_06565 [Paenibacillus sp. SC116]|uniref:hypothetical protein n=1 Tax=Paenibacillus sp. SC116 TaxID=2968986 RepID=UPI00215A69DB|nr:hypothetical protein [Paenibacillus sp. SC116]MCR8843341.1 hypothetical protein [Paenibacillus sp. SC116]
MRLSLIRYFLLSFSRTNRYVAPLMVYVLAFTLFYSQRPNPIIGSYAATAVIFLFIAGWFSYAFHESQDRVQEQLALLHTKKMSTYFLSKWGALALMLAGLALITVLYPIAIGAFADSISFQMGLLAFFIHLEVGLIASGVAQLFQSRFVASKGMSVSGIIIVFALSLSHSKLDEVLPDMLHFLLWLLPPVKQTIEGITQSVELSMQEMLWIHAVTLGYVALLLVIYVVWVKRTDMHCK